MELHYTFDSERFRLGTLCKHGHAFPGTNQSLRRIHSRAAACVGCSGRKQSEWIYSYLDNIAMGLPEAAILGKLCKKKHYWNGLSATLRINGRCEDCEKLKALVKRKTPFGPKLDRQSSRRINKAEIRARLRNQGLTSRGTVPVRADGAVPKGETNEAIALEQALKRAINSAGQSLSVARLVMAEQRRYWIENPKAKQDHVSQWSQTSWWLKYQIDPDLRLYHREKSKRRKAQAKGQTPLQIPVSALRQRFNEFGNCCAYCGGGGDMEIEHVDPIDNGGPHDIGNIVPACSRCNTSKRTHDMESWYRSQPFFSQLRLQRIRRVMRWPEGHQLALALA